MVGVTPSSIMFRFWFVVVESAADAGASAALAEKPLMIPVDEKTRLVIRSRALAHLAHFFGKCFGPGEAPREIAPGARLEQQPITAGLDELGQRSQPACDHRQTGGERLDQRPRYG